MTIQYWGSPTLAQLGLQNYAVPALEKEALPDDPARCIQENQYHIFSISDPTPHFKAKIFHADILFLKGHSLNGDVTHCGLIAYESTALYISFANNEVVRQLVA